MIYLIKHILNEYPLPNFFTFLQSTPTIWSMKASGIFFGLAGSFRWTCLAFGSIRFYSPGPAIFRLHGTNFALWKFLWIIVRDFSLWIFFPLRKECYHAKNKSSTFLFWIFFLLEKAAYSHAETGILLEKSRFWPWGMFLVKKGNPQEFNSSTDCLS